MRGANYRFHCVETDGLYRLVMVVGAFSALDLSTHRGGCLANRIGLCVAE